MHPVVPVPCRPQGLLVRQAGQIGPDHAGRRRGYAAEINVTGQRDRPGVDLEDPQPPGPVRRLDRNPAVETAGPEQGRVEDLRPIGRR